MIEANGRPARYDVCLAWNWEYDAGFVTEIEAACRAQGLSLLSVTPDNLEMVAQSLRVGRLTYRVYWDRASDSDERFLVLDHWARTHRLKRFNPHEMAARAWDKAAMHRSLRGIVPTPNTIILPSFQEQPQLGPVDLSVLGSVFCIKPAKRGGGEGVVLEATHLDQVLAARQEYPTDRYLLHPHIVPTVLDHRLAWFRVFYCAGQILPCWWDQAAHRNTPVTAAEASHYRLAPLASLAHAIASVCRLHLFSSEIAMTDDGCFSVVDYVNDPVDLRRQSCAVDGIPDDIVAAVASRMVWLARQFVSDELDYSVSAQSRSRPPVLAGPPRC
jgi:hypothetical protein